MRQLGARDVWVYEAGGTYYMHYDGAGPKGWLACLATSKDLVHWTKKGPVLDFGKPGEDDSASASYGVTYFDGKTWHMFYLGTPHATPAAGPDPGVSVPDDEGQEQSPAGPWVKQKDVVPFRTKPGTYYSDTASPGQVVKQGDEYLMFFSASMKRTIGIARTKDLDGPGSIRADPAAGGADRELLALLRAGQQDVVPVHQPRRAGRVRVHRRGLGLLDQGPEPLGRRRQGRGAGRQELQLEPQIIGLPSVVKVGNRLAVLYDGPGGDSKSHMHRDIGLAWLELPLTPPVSVSKGSRSLSRN